jgi:hypothetical protein
VKKKTIVVGLLAVALLLFGVYFSQNSSTPPGQEPLATLTSGNFFAFEQSFDNLPDGSRLVLLLSPT